MEIIKGITITGIRANITPRVIKSIVAFVELEILGKDNNAIFIARGYTIKIRSFGDKAPVFVVDAPAYKSGYKWKKSFIVEKKSLWFEIEKQILSEFVEMTGGKQPEDYISEKDEDVDPDEMAKIFA